MRHYTFRRLTEQHGASAKRASPSAAPAATAVGVQAAGASSLPPGSVEMTPSGAGEITVNGGAGGSGGSGAAVNDAGRAFDQAGGLSNPFAGMRI